MTEDLIPAAVTPKRRKIVILLDRSYSMTSIKSATEEGVHAFLAEQLETDKTGNMVTRVTLYQFDDRFEEVFADRLITELPPFLLEPRGQTALNDAVAETISRTRRHRKGQEKEDRAEILHYLIVTDGQENVSRLYPGMHNEALQRLVEEERARKGRVIQYMGANQDAEAVGQRLGVDRKMSMSYSASGAGTRSAWGAASASASRGAMSGELESYAFTGDERDASMMDATPAPALHHSVDPAERQDIRDYRPAHTEEP